MGGISVFILMGILSFMFFTFIAIFMAIIVYAIISYVFESISIMCMSKNLKYKLPITAWIPFYNKYLLGKIVGNKWLGIMIVLLNIATVSSGIYCYLQIQFNLVAFVIFLLSTLVGFILDIIVAHKLYKNVSNKYGDILTVLSVLSFGFLRPIFLFMIRNNLKKTDNNKVMEIK